jgi:hypothetical protein
MKLPFTQTDGMAVLNTAIPVASGCTGNSPNCLMLRASGFTVYKTITLSANNTTASVNVFSLTGSVKVRKIYGFITTAATLANLTVASFDLYDSTAVVQITAAGGALSGMAVGTFFAKCDKNDADFVVSNNVAGAIMEPIYEGSELFSMFALTKKTGANTYLRFTYTTTDAPIAATLTIFAEYYPLDSTGVLAAV